MNFWIDQHGCAKNQVDGEELCARLEAVGHSFVDSSEKADLIIVNTCGFIESAKKESLNAVLAFKKIWPDKKILVAGCLSQRYPEILAADLPEADGILGNTDLSLVKLAAAETLAGKRPVLAPAAQRPAKTLVAPARLADAPAETLVAPARAFERRHLFDYPGTAHVKITEGCSNYCSYCAIPLIRGGLRSRHIDDILAECKGLISRGIKELVLIGQDLGAYGDDLRGSLAPTLTHAPTPTPAQTPAQLPPAGAAPDLGAAADLGALLAALSALPGEFRVRTLYIHPDHFPDSILDVMRRDPRILPYFDLPFQHASGPLLRAMNRRGDKDTYVQLVRRIRGCLPDAMIRSTFLVGFPGETETDFAMLRQFQDEAQLDWLGVFTYSREEDTPAYSMKGRVAKKTAQARKEAIEAAQTPITEGRLARFAGTEIDVLVEETVQGEDLSLGRAWMQAPDVDGLVVLRGTFAPGSIVRARVLAARGVDLDAQPTKKAST